MDVVLLSRLQFALAACFHFIFPPLTLGITLIIVYLEAVYYKKGDEKYKLLSTFAIKILGLIFTIGVATGIVLEFSFGTNWSSYSRLVGDIFGAPLAAEGVFAFFLESFFIAILLFGREKVSKKVFLFSAIMVCFASHMSGFWIIIANSWMQTPAGFKLIGDKVVLTSFFDAAFNPSTIVRYVHTILGAWITGSLFLAGISSWYLLKDRDRDLFEPMLKISLIIFILTSFAQFGSGHAHAVQVAKTQPEKMAAFEGLWKTQKGAPLSVFGIPSEKDEKTYLEIGIPKLLSWMIYMDGNATIKGLKDFPKKERPPVIIPFWSYHFMIWLGSLYAGLAFLGIILLWRKKLYTFKPFLWGLLLASPLPILTNEFGWIAAEVGRQPWAVYKILLTADAASKVVPAWQILFSMIMFAVVYTLFFFIFMVLLIQTIKKGPRDIGTDQY